MSYPAILARHPGFHHYQGKSPIFDFTDVLTKTIFDIFCYFQFLIFDFLDFSKSYI